MRHAIIGLAIRLHIFVFFVRIISYLAVLFPWRQLFARLFREQTCPVVQGLHTDLSFFFLIIFARTLLSPLFSLTVCTAFE